MIQQRIVVQPGALALLCALSVLTGLIGCSAQPSGDPARPSQGQATPSASPGGATVSLSQEQREALRDGSVTRAEYQAGFERFAACAKHHGHTITFVGETNSVFDYRMTETASKSPDVTSCYESEFEEIDIAWQTAHEDDSAGAQQAAKCLTTWKMEIPPRYADRVRLLDAAGIDLATCQKQ